LTKRLEIGKKWAEIIKQMPGRTENNIKNRFNMLLKTMKDEAIRNMEHDNIKDASKNDAKLDILREEELVSQLIIKKKKEFSVKKLSG
jgi:hypothetical protein